MKILTCPVCSRTITGKSYGEPPQYASFIHICDGFKLELQGQANAVERFVEKIGENG